MLSKGDTDSHELTFTSTLYSFSAKEMCADEDSTIFCEEKHLILLKKLLLKNKNQFSLFQKIKLSES